MPWLWDPGSVTPQHWISLHIWSNDPQYEQQCNFFSICNLSVKNDSKHIALMWEIEGQHPAICASIMQPGVLCVRPLLITARWWLKCGPAHVHYEWWKHVRIWSHIRLHSVHVLHVKLPVVSTYCITSVQNVQRNSYWSISSTLWQSAKDLMCA